MVSRKKVLKISLTVLAVYAILACLFYFLAGDQLRFRNSRGNVEMLPAESGTVELVRGAVVEQSFAARIQRLESVSVQWGTYYRPNAGTITMELIDASTGTVLLSGQFDAAAIPEGGLTTLTADTPIETAYGVPLVLRLTADSQAGSAASPLMAATLPETYAEQTLEASQLTLNGVPAAGALCYAVSGEDYIWTGLHYWKFCAAGAVLILLFLFVFWKRCRAGKRSYLLNAAHAMRKYRFLIRQLVSRDFKTKYKRSVLGVFWSFLNPLLTMIVQYFVFSTIFKSDIPNYPAYLLVGIVSFNFFSESCGMALTSILGNASLITKVYVPKYVYPLTRVLSSVINLGISLIPLVLVCVFTGVQFRKSVVLAFFFLLCLILFSYGLSLLLSAAMVFFRDMQFLWNVLSMIWMYATPIFYPESILPENFRFVLAINPLYYFIQNTRLCILDGLSPEPTAYLQCMLIALGMLLVGSLVFRKSQDRFVLYL